MKQKIYFIYLEIKWIRIRIDVLFVKQQHFKLFILGVSFPPKNSSSCYHGTIMWLSRSKLTGWETKIISLLKFIAPLFLPGKNHT